MKVKLCFRIPLLTLMLLMLASPLKTQTAAACSPGCYEGCASGCDEALGTCLGSAVGNGVVGVLCAYDHNKCTGNYSSGLAACSVPVSGPEQ